MHCPGCNMPIDEEGAFCGHCGEQLESKRPYSPMHTRVAPVAQKIGQVGPVVQWQHITLDEVPVPQNFVPLVAKSPFSMHVGSKTPPPMSNKPNTPVPVPPLVRSMPVSGHSLEPVNGTGRNMVFLSIVLTILIVGILAGALTLVQHKSIPGGDTGNPLLSGAKGSASFSDGQGQPNSSLSISVDGLRPLTDGSRYVAWMVNEETEHASLLGTLKQEDASYSLNFQHSGASVLSMGNKLEITQEGAQTTLPTGPVMLSGRLPMESLVHIKHLLISFPDAPGKIGLLVGLRGQAQQLYDQTHQLNGVKDQYKTRCIAQSIINLIEGNHSTRVHPLNPVCATKHVASVDDGYGLLGNDNNGYIANVAMHASLAATQPDTTETIRASAQRVIDASDNFKGWLSTIDQDAQTLQDNPTGTDRAQDMIGLSERIINGIDLDHNGHIESIKGEAGMNNAYQDGQAMAKITLLPSA